jgi:hypothetical protein
MGWKYIGLPLFNMSGRFWLPIIGDVVRSEIVEEQPLWAILESPLYKLFSPN